MIHRLERNDNTMNRLYRLKNSRGIRSMVVADNEETIKRLAFHFRVIMKVETLEYWDTTDAFPQYSQEAIDEVCNNAPFGMASVMIWGGPDARYRWIVLPEKGRPWYGTEHHYE